MPTGSILLLLMILISTPTWSQNPEAGVTVLGQFERLLRIDSNRPLDSAAYILASAYQIDISAEDPPFACSEDVIYSHPSRRSALAAEHAYIPKGAPLRCGSLSAGADILRIRKTFSVELLRLTPGQQLPIPA